MEKMHDEVHDVREMMVSITVIISTVMLSHIIAKKNKKQKWKETQARKVHYMLHLYFMTCFKSSDVSM